MGRGRKGGAHTFFRIIAARDIWGMGYGGGLFFDKVRYSSRGERVDIS